MRIAIEDPDGLEKWLSGAKIFNKAKLNHMDLRRPKKG
jgi:hypothetical protein